MSTSKDPRVCVWLPMGTYLDLQPADTWVPAEGAVRILPERVARELVTRLASRGARLVENEQLSKRQRVELLLAQPDAAHLGIRKLARLAGCSKTYAAEVARELYGGPRPRAVVDEQPIADRLKEALSRVQ